MEILADAASRGDEHGPPPGRFVYPFTLPPDVAVVCRNPGDGKFYCQVPRCRAVLGSSQGSYNHLTNVHGRYSQDKRHVMVKIVPVAPEEKKARKREQMRACRRRQRESHATLISSSTGSGPAVPSYGPENPALDPLVLAVSRGRGATFPLKVLLAQRGKGDVIMAGILDKQAKEAVSVALGWVRRVGRELSKCISGSEAETLQQQGGGGAGREDLWLGQTHDLCLSFQDAKNCNKNGGSLGAAVALGVAVALLQHRTGEDKVSLRRGVGISGEVNLRGELLAVDGVAEKLKAAEKAGCRLVVLPSANRQEVEEAMRATDAGPYREWLEEVVVLADDMADVLLSAVTGFQADGVQALRSSASRLGTGRSLLLAVDRPYQIPTVEIALVPGGSGKTVVTGCATAVAMDELAAAVIWCRHNEQTIWAAVADRAQRQGRAEPVLALPVPADMDLHVHLSPGGPWPWKAMRQVGSAMRVALASLVTGVPSAPDTVVLGRTVLVEGQLEPLVMLDAAAMSRLWVNARDVQNIRRVFVSQLSVELIERSGADSVDIDVHGVDTITQGLHHLLKES